MRRRFAIPGDEWEDYFSWMCCAPCTLCQETRTLSGNGVEDGVWPAHTGNAGYEKGGYEKQPLLPTTPPAAVTPPAASGEKQV